MFSSTDPTPQLRGSWSWVQTESELLCRPLLLKSPTLALISLRSRVHLPKRARRISRNALSNGDSLSRRQASESRNFGVVGGSGRKTTSEGYLWNKAGRRDTPNPADTSSRTLVGPSASLVIWTSNPASRHRFEIQ